MESDHVEPKNNSTRVWAALTGWLACGLLVVLVGGLAVSLDPDGNNSKAETFLSLFPAVVAIVIFMVGLARAKKSLKSIERTETAANRLVKRAV
ncbi:hypothetical protein OIU34_20585 [Pararhizobium sp. BT-229]|uniref:hypothetical protein n=1 Tax=Pararhizobium sp. BT-229 TaxID=2986923 RepID=UPI0021F6AC9C|nr:hypothetical protein [Pararhizobium sp. BT-229]MCV9964287.1 hypothetical protein [Pararhizobium sp. BT-229]